MQSFYSQSAMVMSTLIAEGCGVRVVWDPTATTASTNGEIMTLPVFRESEMSSFKDLFYGYVWHECAHLRETNFLAHQSLERHIFPLYNILEDVRIEKRLIRCFPGSATFLVKLETALVNTNPGLHDVPPSPSVAQTLLKFMYCYLRDTQLAQGLSVQARAWEAALDVVLPGARGTIASLALQASDAADSFETVLFARRIWAFVVQEVQKQSRDEEGACQTAGQEEKAQSSLAAPSTSDDSADDDGILSTPTEGSVQSPALDLAGISGELEGMAATCDRTSSIVSMMMDVPKSGRGVSMPHLIRTAPRADPSRLRTASARSSEASQQFRRALLGVNQCSRRLTVSGSKIEPRSIYRACIDGRVFVRKTDTRTENARIIVLRDDSGSMKSISQQAALATLGFTAALQRIEGLKVCAVAFARTDESVDLLTDFSESAIASSGRHEAVAIGNSTPMAQAMLWAHKHILSHRLPGERLIVLFITDGQPSCSASMTERMHAAQQDDIEVWGVGIRTAVDSLFSISAQIQDINQLPTAVLTLVRSSLNAV